MKSDQLQARSKNELIALARKKGVEGWHGMRKEELVAALTKALRRPVKVAARPTVAAKPHVNGNGAVRHVVGRSVRPRPQRAAARSTSAPASPAEEQAERSK